MNRFATLVWKDIRLFFKNRFFALVSILGLVFYAVIFFALPNRVDETLELGWYGPSRLAEALVEYGEEGLILNTYPSDQALQEAVLAGDEAVGLALPDDFVQQIAQGGRPQAVVYLRSDVPEEYRSVYDLLVEEIGFMISGQELNLEVEEHILGPDMAGQQVPPRQRILPLMAVFMLMVETWGLAALITNEVERGTLRALMVTPLTVPELFLSKGAAGVLMAFGQVAILLGITGGLRREPLLIITALLLGALLVTGVSFLIASVSRDFMSVVASGMLAMIVLSIPGMNVLLPGLASGWIKAIPSYYLVDLLYRTINFGTGWAEQAANLAALLAFSLAIFGLGVVVFGRKLR